MNRYLSRVPFSALRFSGDFDDEVRRFLRAHSGGASKYRLVTTGKPGNTAIEIVTPGDATEYVRPGEWLFIEPDSGAGAQMTDEVFHQGFTPLVPPLEAVSIAEMTVIAGGSIPTDRSIATMLERLGELGYALVKPFDPAAAK